jgi:type IV secretion system protein VirB5
VNNPATRNYLPAQWGQSLNLISSPGTFGSLSGSITALRNASKLVDVTATTLPPGSLLGQAYTAAQDQAAINRGMSEASYAAASDRMANIQTLLDKVNDAPDEKDILDLQARIQAEQAMVQNESNKIASVMQLQQAQRDIQAQRAREISIASGYRPVVTGW